MEKNERYKTKIVAKGFYQKNGTDYDEAYTLAFTWTNITRGSNL